MNKKAKLKFARRILFLAALYSIGWGLLISIQPQWILFGNMSTPFTLIILRCIGMLVGVYGLAYYFSSLDPIRYWPLVLVGLIGKVLGPIGSLFYIFSGDLEKNFFMVNIFNDLIWILPFSWILIQVLKNDLTDHSGS